MHRATLARAVQVHHVQGRRPLLGEQPGLRDRVLVEDRLLGEVALHEAHGAPALEVDRRVERDHAAVLRPASAST